eukprot:9018059-Alexandrium_andersonii.AAC.1
MDVALRGAQTCSGALRAQLLQGRRYSRRALTQGVSSTHWQGSGGLWRGPWIKVKLAGLLQVCGEEAEEGRRRGRWSCACESLKP